MNLEPKKHVCRVDVFAFERRLVALLAAPLYALSPQVLEARPRINRIDVGGQMAEGSRVQPTVKP